MNVIKPLKNIINKAQIHTDNSQYDTYGNRFGNNTEHLSVMVPLILKGVNEDRVPDPNSTLLSLQKMIEQVKGTRQDNMDPNTMARDNYRRR